MGFTFAFVLLSMCDAEVKSACSWYTFANTELYRGLYLMTGSPDYCLRWIRSGFSLSMVGVLVTAHLRISNISR